MIDDDASRIADQRSEEPSSAIEQRSEEALGDGRDGSGALLGLELATIENSGQNPEADKDSNPASPIFPLLGTNSLKSLSKSSNGRSTQRVCNDLLLRFGAHSSGLSSGKTARNGPRGCYGFSPGFMPRGMTLRGDRYYLRRHIPSDIQPIVGRSEVWRSLQTDSLQTALRRFPMTDSDQGHKPTICQSDKWPVMHNPSVESALAGGGEMSENDIAGKIYESVIGTAQASVNYGFLLNGSAAVGLLTFLGSDSGNAFRASLAPSILIFALGVAIAAISSIMLYVTQLSYYKESSDGTQPFFMSGTRLRLAFLACIAISMLIFCYGMLTASRAISGT